MFSSLVKDFGKNPEISNYYSSTCTRKCSVMNVRKHLTECVTELNSVSVYSGQSLNFC